MKNFFGEMNKVQIKSYVLLKLGLFIFIGCMIFMLSSCNMEMEQDNGHVSINKPRLVAKTTTETVISSLTETVEETVEKKYDKDLTSPVITVEEIKNKKLNHSKRILDAVKAGKITHKRCQPKNYFIIKYDDIYMVKTPMREFLKKRTGEKENETKIVLTFKTIEEAQEGIYKEIVHVAKAIGH